MKILIILLFIIIIILFAKLQKKQVIDQDIIKTNNENLQKSILYKQEVQDLLNQTEKLEHQKSDLMLSIDSLHESYSVLDDQYEKYLNITQKNFDNSLEKRRDSYLNAEQEYQDIYQQVLKDSVRDYEQKIQDKQTELSNVLKELQKYQTITLSAIEASKRENILKDNYCLTLSEADLKEVNAIREIIPLFRDARPLNKAIWEGYFRTPANKLCEQIIGNKQITGIYKITNLKNNKIYIGQAVNVSNRLKEHIKAGLGIDTPNNILYKGMKKYNVENFSFELLERCNPQELNDREKFWISYFKSNDYGYNMTVGGSAKK